MLQVAQKRLYTVVFFLALGCLGVFSPCTADQAPETYYLMNSSVEKVDQTIPLSEFMFPNEYERVLAAYHAGNFRLCILELEDLINLGLPDGRTDTYLFIAGECYHQLKLDKFAFKLFNQLLEEYAESPYCRFAAYRLQESAYYRADEAGQKRYFAVIAKRYTGTDIAQASLFLEGKRLYKANQPADADKLLSGIPEKSAMFSPASFVRSLCALQSNNYEKAVLQLDVVLRRTRDKPLFDEAALILADIYHKLKKDELAAKLLKDIGPSSAKYGDALLFQSQFHLGKGDFEKAAQTGEKLLFYNRGAYMFEAAMVLESAYMKLGQRAKVDTLRNYLEVTVRKRKIVFQLYRELDILTDMQGNFNYFCQKETAKYGTLENRRRVTHLFEDFTAKISGLKERDAALLFSVDQTAYVVGSSGIYEIRYIEHLDHQIKAMSQAADSLSKVLTLYAAKAEGRDPETEKAYLKEREDILNRIQTIHELKEDIRTHCLSENPYLSGTEDVEAKFVDWNILHLEEMKNRLRNVYREISKLQQKNPAEKEPAPSTPGTK